MAALATRDARASTRRLVRALTVDAHPHDMHAMAVAMLENRRLFSVDKVAQRAWNRYTQLLAATGASPLPVTTDRLLEGVLARRAQGQSIASAITWWQGVKRFALSHFPVRQVPADDPPIDILRCLAITFPTAGYRETQPLRLDELTSLCTSLGRTVSIGTDPRWQIYLMACVGWHACLRVSELIQLRAQDVDINRVANAPHLRVRVLFGKTRKTDGKPHMTSVPIAHGTRLETVLTAWARTHGWRLGPGGSSSYLFPIITQHRQAGLPYATSTFIKRLNALAADADLNVTYNGRSLRYGGAQRLLSDGVASASVADIVGWTSSKQLHQRYGRERALTKFS